MDNNRGQGIFLSVVGIATLLVAIVGATFAYFSIQVSGNEQASSIAVTTANVGGVTFTDGPQILVTNAYPGYTKSKTFTIESTNLDNDQTIVYIVQLVTTEAGLSDVAAAKHDFIYDLSVVNNGTYGSTQDAVNDHDMPTSTGTVDLATGVLQGTSSHTYTFGVELVEHSTDQDELQGLSYVGYLQVTLATGEGLRTWDETRSTWKTYNPAGN